MFNRWLLLILVPVIGIAIFFLYQTNPEKFSEIPAAIGLPTENCIGENCGDTRSPNGPGGNTGSGTEQPGTGTAGAGGGGAGSYTPPSLELIESNYNYYVCLGNVINYCDEWSHKHYDVNNLPYNLTFIDRYPECRPLEYFQQYGNPTGEDCVHFYLNTSSGLIDIVGNYYESQGGG